MSLTSVAFTQFLKRRWKFTIMIKSSSLLSEKMSKDDISILCLFSYPKCAMSLQLFAGGLMISCEWLSAFNFIDCLFILTLLLALMNSSAFWDLFHFF